MRRYLSRYLGLDKVTYPNPGRPRGSRGNEGWIEGLEKLGPPLDVNPELTLRPASAPTGPSRPGCGAARSPSCKPPPLPHSARPGPRGPRGSRGTAGTAPDPG